MTDSALPPAAARVTIVPIEDGPLVVTGLTQCLRDSGEHLAIDGTAYLCRCGQSRDKPFCDGSHNQAGFSTATTTGSAHGPTREYAGDQVTLLDNRSACAHVGFCTEFAPKVFSQERKPWIDPGASPPSHVMRTVELCPSGALALAIEKRRARFRTGDKAQLHVLRDGPYCVIGPAVLEAPLQPLDSSRFTLCRCGGSANKPFCDGSHHSRGFKG